MKNLKILLFDEEDLTKTLIESYLKDLTFPFSFEKYSEFDEFFIDETDENRIIIVDINKFNIEILDKIAKISSKNNNFIIISYDKSADISVKAFRNGAKDFLLKPLIKSDFLFSVNTIYKKLNALNENVKSKIYTVSSLSEGDGKSTFIVNLAKEIVDISKEKVLLIDFNNFPDNVKSIIEIQNSYNVNYFINNLSQFNSENFISKIPAYNDSLLHVITGGFYEKNSEQTDINKIVSAFNILKKYYRYIFIDKNINNLELNTKIEEISDIIFFIITSNSIDFENIKDKLKSFNEKKLVIICNKYEQKEDKKINQIESVIEREISAKIPRNIISVNKALRELKTLKEIEPQLDIVKEYAKTADYIIKRE